MTAAFHLINSTQQLEYKKYELGKFSFHRDDYFAYIKWSNQQHIMPIDIFLRALMRDIAWDFFYGTVNFDSVFGTINHYGKVDIFVGMNHKNTQQSHLYTVETFATENVRKVFIDMLADWVHPDYDPFAAPQETIQPFGPKVAGKNHWISRQRICAQRMVGMQNDIQRRTDATGHTINRHFLDVSQEEPIVNAEPGFENEVCAFNLFAYLSRSDVTWNPSVCSVVENSLFCPTSEEYILPVIHGNDRVEWFIQLSDEITWDVSDKHTGEPRARLVMRAGDIAAMPADIRHQGYSPKRSMLLVWENASNDIPSLIEAGDAPVVPIQF